MGPLEFFDRVRAYCAWAGASVSSYGRTWWHNAAVEGAEYSAHQGWLGADTRTWDHLTDGEKRRVRAKLNRADFVVDVPPLTARVEAARRLGLRLIPEGDHDHLQPWTWERS